MSPAGLQTGHWFSGIRSIFIHVVTSSELGRPTLQMTEKKKIWSKHKTSPRISQPVVNKTPSPPRGRQSGFYIYLSVLRFHFNIAVYESERGTALCTVSVTYSGREDKIMDVQKQQTHPKREKKKTERGQISWMKHFSWQHHINRFIAEAF